jgi:hypothetical protein
MEMGVSRFYATEFARGWPHPVVDSLSWFAIYHLGHAALFEATGLGIVCVFVVVQRSVSYFILDGKMRLYIQHGAKLIVNQLGCLYRHFGANSDGAACFLIPPASYHNSVSHGFAWSTDGSAGLSGPLW